MNKRITCCGLYSTNTFHISTGDRVCSGTIPFVKKHAQERVAIASHVLQSLHVVITGRIVEEGAEGAVVPAPTHHPLGGYATLEAVGNGARQTNVVGPTVYRHGDCGSNTARYRPKLHFLSGRGKSRVEGLMKL
jgi:hypothetical protein